MTFSLKRKNENLKIEWNNKKIIIEFTVSLLILVVTMLTFSHFTVFIEARRGFQFNDPFLSIFQAIDLTNYIFVFIYGAILFAISFLIVFPDRLIILFEAYTLMVLIRILMMYVLPLSPPPGMILLQDPFVEFFGKGKTLVNDLFFSGHTATMFLLFLTVPERIKKHFFMIFIAVASGVLLQKVHYTVDVLVAPFISFASYRIVKYFRRIYLKN
ncbi:MAG: phosphatase PAP2-related protein [Bacteriovorax sp.]|nr:phosphatase PAP2-related protein [Bacteriovorax sp.]